jgi:SAM-dependent methyltransferase
MSKPRRPAGAAPSIRGGYAEYGVRAFYAQHGTDYRNPHEAVIREVLPLAVGRWQLALSDVLDLACGSGEVTLALRERGAARVAGIDPYTGAAYQARTGQAAEPYSFEQIAAGALEGRRYSLIVCSFALHLAADSWLPALCLRLSEISPALLVLTPHKRPQLRAGWGWQVPAEEFLHKRVRARRWLAVPPPSL